MAMNIALIGLGRIGRLHAENLSTHARFRLSCVYDINSAVAADIAAQYNTVAAPTIETIFTDNSIAAVLIASATATHCDLIEQAVQSNKAVLCEKPLDLNISRVRHCANLLKNHPQAIIQVGFNRRFDPGHAALIRRVRAKEIGKLEKLIITSRDPNLPSTDYLAASGGLFHDMMIHDFDMARAVLEDEPQRISACAGALVSPQVCELAKDVDTAMVMMQTASGVMCHINCSRRAVYGYDQRIEAFGSEGMLISANHTPTQVQTYNSHQTASRDLLQNFFVDRYADSYRLQLDAFADTIDNITHDTASPTPSFEDGIRALQLADAAAAAVANANWQEVA